MACIFMADQVRSNAVVLVVWLSNLANRMARTEWLARLHVRVGRIAEEDGVAAVEVVAAAEPWEYRQHISYRND